MKIKKIGLLGLSGLIGIQSVALQANEFKDNVLLNVTPGGSYDVNGKSFYTTPSVYFRFGPSQMNFEPIWHVSPPSIGASCSGFNLQGLFVSIIGWDRISKMLKSAGASFAWGIVVGLIYSLPGIFSAFKMINAWAKKIMQLLQNACRAGQNFGKALTNGGPLDFGQKESFSEWDKTMESLTPEAQVKAAESGKDSAYIGKGLAFLNKWALEDFDPNETKITPEAIKEIYKAQLMHIYSIETPGNEFFNNSILFAKGSGNDSALPTFLQNNAHLDYGAIISNPEKAAMFTTYRIGFGNIEQFINIFYGSNSSDKMIGYVNYIIDLLKFNAKKTWLLKTSTVEAISEAANIAAKTTNQGTEGSPDDKFKSTLGGLETNVGLSGSSAVEGSPKLLGKLFGSYLMGNTDEELLKQMAKLKVFNFTLLALSEASTEPSNVAFLLSQSDGLGTSSTMTDYTDRMFFSSTDTPIKERFESFFTDILENDIDPEQAADSNRIPFLVSVTGNYLKIYKQTVKEERDDLKQSLVNSGICLYSIGVLDLFDKASLTNSHTNRVYSLTSTSLEFSNVTNKAGSVNKNLSSDPSSNEDYYNEFRKELSSVMLNKELIGAVPDSYNGDMEGFCRNQIKLLKDTFNKQDIKNQQRSQAVLDRLAK